MNNRNRNTYQEDIRSAYQEKGCLLLPETTSLKIKKRCLFLLEDGLKGSDKTIIISFLKLSRGAENLLELVDEADVDKFKPIRNFFSDKNLRYDEAHDFAAFITAFSPRPYLNYLKEGVAQENGIKEEIPIDKINLSENKKLPFKPLIIVGMIMLILVSLWIIKDLFKTKEIIKPQKIEITNNNYSGDTTNYYYYFNSKGEIELYDKKGIVANQQLIPITKEIMLTYFEQNKDENIRNWTKETILDKDEKIEEVLTEKELKKESKNTELIKPKTIKSTKVVITDNTIFDAFASMTFKQKYTKVKEKYTCTGTVEYTYKGSSVSNKLTVCNAVLVYTIVSNNTGEEIDSGIINSAGTDSSESGAKQNAISRLIIK